MLIYAFVDASITEKDPMNATPSKSDKPKNPMNYTSKEVTITANKDYHKIEQNSLQLKETYFCASN